MKTKYYKINYWSEKKLDYFKKYLSAYTTIFKRKPWAKTIFVDMFAGPGMCFSKSRDIEVEGSPIIALKSSPTFSRYIFNDLDKRNTEKIKKLIRQKSIHVDAQVENKDANIFVDEVVSQLKNNNPTLVLLDPQALDLKYNTILTFANRPLVDFFINFPVSPLRRMIGRKKCPNLCQKQNCTICPKEIFGSQAWITVVEKKREGNYSNLTEHKRDLLRAYMDPLEALGYKWAVKHIRNSNKSPIYDLIFASKNSSIAMCIIRDVMFGDEKQLTLWPINEDEIKSVIQKNFTGVGSVLTEDAYSIVLTGDNTYREKDLQSALRSLEEDGSLARDIPLISKRKKKFDFGVTFKIS